MELYVAEALKQVGEPFSFSLSERMEPLSYGQRDVVFASDVRLSGSYVFDGAGFSVEANGEAVLVQQCARCAKAFDEPVTFPVVERFSKSAEPESDDMYPYAGDRLDLTRAVLDNLLLHMPLTSVCRPDCKGLCPICGADRNVTECSCQPIQQAGPFAGLAALTDEE